MKAKLLLPVLLLFISSISFSQVSIGHKTADKSAVVDVSEEDEGGNLVPKGVLVPRMTTAERDAIASPAIGLIIFNTEVNCNEIYIKTADASVWQNLCASRTNDPGEGGYTSNGTAVVNGYDCSEVTPQDPAYNYKALAEIPASAVAIKTITADVKTVGTYDLKAIVNGITFAAKDTFAGTGKQSIVLKATGTPLEKGTFEFSLNTQPDCSFIRKVSDASSGGDAVVNTWECIGLDTGTLTAGREITATGAGAVTKIITANVAKADTYNIVFAATNGVIYKAIGTFTGTGNQEVTLTASGTPLEVAAAANNKFTLPLTPSCSFNKEVLINPTSNGTAEVSAYSWDATMATTGDFHISEAVVEGAVTQNIKATVVSRGKYKIRTNTANGVSFYGEGEFTTTGDQTITLKAPASAAPLQMGMFDYKTDTNPDPIFCTIKRETKGKPSSGGESEINTFDCAGGVETGKLIAGSLLAIGEVTQTVKVDVRVAGSYNIETKEVNGIKFVSRGEFTAPLGAKTITFHAVGTPTTVGTHTFPITTYPPNCSFSRETFPKNTSGGESVVTSYTCGTSDGKTIEAGKAYTVADDIKQLTLNATVATAGSYYIRAINNGIVFAGSGTFVVGANTFELYAIGAGDTTGTVQFTLDVTGVTPCTFDRTFGLNPSSNGTADIEYKSEPQSPWGSTINVCSGDGAIAEGILEVNKPFSAAGVVTQKVWVNVKTLGTYNLSLKNVAFTAKVPAAGTDVPAGGVYDITFTADAINGVKEFTTLGWQLLNFTATSGISGNITYDENKWVRGDLPIYNIAATAPRGCSFIRYILNDNTTGGTAQVTTYTCNPSTPKGNLINTLDSALTGEGPADAPVTHTFTANVTIPGSFYIASSTVNGVTFVKKSGFPGTGSQTFSLNANGTTNWRTLSPTAPYSTTSADFTLYTANAADGTPDMTKPLPTAPCEYNRTILEKVQYTAQPTTTCGQADGTVTITATVVGGGTITYKWYKGALGSGTQVNNGSNGISTIAGATTNTLTITNPTSAEAGTYYLVANNGSTPASAETSSVVTVVLPTVTTTHLPAAETRCSTGTFSLIAKAGTDAGATKTRWYNSSGVLMAGGEVNSEGTFTTPPLTAGAASVIYKVAAYNPTTYCLSQKTSVTVTASVLPTVTTNATADRCGKGDVTLASTIGAPTTNVVAKWYDALTGGTARADANVVKFATDPTTANEVKTVYVEAENTVTGCKSAARTLVTVTAKVAPTGQPTIVSPTAVADKEKCGDTTFSLKATAGTGGDSVRWYKNGVLATGGQVLSDANFSTGSLPQSTTAYTYTVDTYNAATGCPYTGATAKPSVVLKANPIPTVTLPTNVTGCANVSATVTFTVTNGTHAKFYTDAGAYLNAQAAPVNWTANYANTKYRVTGYNSTTTCESALPTTSNYVMTAKPVPTAPTAVPSAACSGSAVSLGASVVATTPVTTVQWYDTNTSTAVLGSANSYTTPALTSTRDFFALAVLNGCLSNTRTSVIATIRPLPANPTATGTSRCGTGTTTVTASTTTAGAIINWYLVSPPGTGTVQCSASTSCTNPSLASTTTYYAEAVLNGCISAARAAAIATIKPIPANPTATGTSRCGTGTTTVTASTTTAGATINWYLVSPPGTGTVQCSSSTSCTNPSLASTTTYYAEAVLNGCISAARAAAIATINPIPTISFVQNQSGCAGAAVSVPITVGNGNQVRWYTVGSNTVAGTNNTTAGVFTWNSTFATQSWDATGFDSTTGCETATKSRFNVTAIAIPDAPTVAVNASGCAGAALTTAMSATPASGCSLAWYTAAGAFIGVAPTYQPNVASTTNYLVGSRTNTTPACDSAGTLTVTATINAAPAAPTVPKGVRCKTGTLDLNTISPPAGVVTRWYNSATGGGAIATGNNWTTPSVSSNTTYYAEAFSSGPQCPSATRTAVPIEIVTTSSVVSLAGRYIDIMRSQLPYTIQFSCNLTNAPIQLENGNCSSGSFGDTTTTDAYGNFSYTPNIVFGPTPTEWKSGFRTNVPGCANWCADAVVIVH